VTQKSDAQIQIIWHQRKQKFPTYNGSISLLGLGRFSSLPFLFPSLVSPPLSPHLSVETWEGVNLLQQWVLC